ncbi:MAG: respiratory nitrate reductase subunit gamma [Gammaproteobacteria bacterium]|nr:respiratory nitrate reductase subunit gamma [Gammaproteobacteria bacterium]
MSGFIAALLWVGLVVFVGFTARKIRQYWKTPAPLKIPTTPAPVTQTGVVFRMAREVVLFESLFKSNKWIWVFGWMFHLGLLLAFFRHLRYVVSPENFMWPVISNVIVQSFGQYAGFAMVAGLFGLLARRIVVERIRYISSPSDYLMLLMLIVIGVSGLVMSFVSHIDVVQLKMFVMGLFGFDFQNLPESGALLIHLLLVVVLLLIFPFSKLLHAPGVFFSPTRNQIDNPREKRHLAPWAAEKYNDHVDK